MRLHPLWTARILSRCRSLERLATVAGRHHERLDASGFPAGLDGDLFGSLAGLLACADRFDERTSPRPYRPAVDRDAAADELSQMVDDGVLARSDVDAVLAAVGSRGRPMSVDRPAALTEREVDVLRLLASGSTNRQIAESLGISAKTVGTHVEHV